MSPRDNDSDRVRRVGKLRDAWRGRAPDEGERSASERDEAGKERSDALDSNDRIRREAPDDLETRRRADQLEREIKRSDRRR